MNSIEIVQPADVEWLLAFLRKDPVRNAAVIHDFVHWPERSRLYYIKSGDELSFLHQSAHPAHQQFPVVILEGKPEEVAVLLRHLRPKAPFVVRETPDALASVVRDYFPSAKVYREQRMDVTAESFRPAHRGIARLLGEADVASLTRFFGAPPKAAVRYAEWLKGVRAFYGVFEGEALVAIGSSMVSVPEAWSLVSIETKPEARGRGYATEVTSSLVARALEEAQTVTLTVVKENAAAIRVYEKLGFYAAQDRVWVDCGAGAAP